MTHPAIARAIERARPPADESIPLRVLRAASGEGGHAHASRLAAAERALGMLESAFALHRSLIDAGAVRRAGGVDDADAGALGGVWMLGSATELIAECGDDAAELWGARTHELVRAQMLEFEDLYDAGRSVDRYIEVAEMRTGGLVALAARMGAGPGVGVETEALEAYGRSLGVAVEIRDDVRALAESNGATAGSERIAAGEYGLPVLYALEAEPELAATLGRPLEPDALPALVARVKGAGGIERSERERELRAREARAAIADANAPELTALADEFGEAPG